VDAEAVRLQRLEAYASGWTARAAAGRRVDGSLRVLVIAALFADSPEPTFAQADIQAEFFDGPATRGTMTELYGEMSRGALHVPGVVTEWGRSSLTLAEVRGGEFNNGEPSRNRDFAFDAVALADAQLDLGQFDNDGPDGVPNSGDDDGVVDAVFILYSEVGSHCGGTGPWPHFSRFSFANDGQPEPTDDDRPDGSPIGVDGYVVTTVTDCFGETIGAMPVAAHELGHVLGLPDLYHRAEGSLAVQRRWVVGCWGLMAAGAWGCGQSDDVTGRFGPTHMSAWTKDQMGWLEVEEVGEVVQQEFILEPVQTGGRALRIDIDETESYLVEYRPQVGFDNLIPASGVLIYHVDTEGSHQPAADEDYLVALLEADANLTLQRTHPNGGNRGEPGDAWATDGAGMSFSNATTPRTMTNAGDTSSVTFHDIRIEGGVARIRISTRETAAVVGAQALPTFALRETVDVHLRVGGGALPYTLVARPTLPVGMTASLEAEELVLEGVPVGTGNFESNVGIRDAVGRVGTTVLRFVVAGLNLTRERLLGPLLGNGAEPLTEDEVEVLDNDGNRNGQYDVGDLRAQLVGQ